MRNGFLTGFLVFLLFPTAIMLPAKRSLADTPDVSTTDVAIRVVAYKVPAISAGISCSKTQFYEWSAGRRRIDNSTWVENGDLWHIGSNTKAMTATMIAKLIDEGHFTWDTTVWDLRSMLGMPDMNPYFQDITIEHLLAHRSGMFMPSTIDGPTRTSAGYVTDPTWMRWQVMHSVVTQSQPNIVTHGWWRYGNGNYMLLGIIIERIRNMPFEDVMHEEIFRPLGMLTAGFGMPTDRALNVADPWAGPSLAPAVNVSTVDHTNGHTWSDNSAVKDNLALPRVWNPAGGAYMSTADYLRFTRVHADGSHGSLSISPTTLARAQSAYNRDDRTHPLLTYVENPDYGWGWGVWDDDVYGRVLGHAGSYGRFLSVAQVYVDSGFSAVVTTNTAGDESAAGQAVDDVMAMLIVEAKKFCQGAVDRASGSGVSAGIGAGPMSRVPGLEPSGSAFSPGIKLAESKAVAILEPAGESVVSVGEAVEFSGTGYDEGKVMSCRGANWTARKVRERSSTQRVASGRERERATAPRLRGDACRKRLVFDEPGEYIVEFSLGGEATGRRVTVTR